MEMESEYMRWMKRKSSSAGSQSRKTATSRSYHFPMYAAVSLAGLVVPT